MSRALVVGVDAGGTSTRCVVADTDGTVAGAGRAGGANPHSSERDLAATLRTALAQALPPDARQGVRAGVVGAAGAGGAAREALRLAATRAWHAAGLAGAPITVTDLEVAYAAGTPSPDGVLLLSGTGSLAARFEDGRLAQRCDGYGWLFGDEGSAVWLGVRAVRAALHALDGRGDQTALVAHVCKSLGVTRRPGMSGEQVAQALIAAGFALAPAQLGRLAPAVSEAAAAGDAVASRIAAEAAARLLHAYDTVSPASPATGASAADGAFPATGVSPVGGAFPVGGAGARLSGDVRGLPGRGGVTVLAGSVLLAPGPVARLVRDGIRERTGAEPREAVNGAGGAAALAVARLLGGPVPAEIHARLTAPARFKQR